jgi:hypothetical protein
MNVCGLVERVFHAIHFGSDHALAFFGRAGLNAKTNEGINVFFRNCPLVLQEGVPEVLAAHVAVGIGGTADVAVEIGTIDELVDGIQVRKVFTVSENK